jgi:hypothetical protein
MMTELVIVPIVSPKLIAACIPVLSNATTTLLPLPQPVSFAILILVLMPTVHASSVSTKRIALIVPLLAVISLALEPATTNFNASNVLMVFMLMQPVIVLFVLPKTREWISVTCLARCFLASPRMVRLLMTNSIV